MAVSKLFIEKREPLVYPICIRWHMGTLLSPFKGCQNQWKNEIILCLNSALFWNFSQINFEFWKKKQSSHPFSIVEGLLFDHLVTIFRNHVQNVVHFLLNLTKISN